MATAAATRPLTRLSATALRNASTFESSSSAYICRKCQTSLPTRYQASYIQRRFLNIEWGQGDSAKKYRNRKPFRKSKRQRDAEAATKGLDSGIPQLSADELKDIYSTELFVFRADVSAGNIPQAMQTFENLVDLALLTSDDISNLARQIHTRFRLDRKIKEILPHLQIIISSLKAKTIPGHPLASVHILSTLKEAEEYDVGNEFWKWLQMAGAEHVDSRVYGAAIEYLAYQGTALTSLEDMFKDALEKFSFREDEGGGTHHRATKLMLLQGIATARILHGDWKGSYEALDTCTRLHPTQTPPRVYELFLFQRPVKEAYLVFMMACRGGTPPSSAVFTMLLSQWWQKTENLHGIIQLINAYVGAGGKLSVEHLNHIVFGLLGTLPDAPNPSTTPSTDSMSSLTLPTSASSTTHNLSPQEYIDLIAPIFDIIRQAIEVFRSSGIVPTVSTYNNIITQASKRNLPDIVEAAIMEMINEKIDYTPVTSRVLINAFGDLNDAEKVRSSWDNLVNQRLEQQAQREKEKLRAETPAERRKRSFERSFSRKDDDDYQEKGIIPWDIKDWKALIRACFKTDQKEFILEQLNMYDKQFHSELIHAIRNDLVACEKRSQRDPTMSMQKKGKPKVLNSEQYKKEIEAYGAALDTLESIVLSPVAWDFTSTPVNLEILELPEMDQESLKEIREVYAYFQAMNANARLTSSHDPKSAVPGNDGADSMTRTPTGYTIGQLRFENWLTINRLLFLANSGESSMFRERAVDGDLSVRKKYEREQRAMEKIRLAKGLVPNLLEKRAKGNDVWTDLVEIRAFLGGTGDKNVGTVVEPISSMRPEEQLNDDSTVDLDSSVSDSPPVVADVLIDHSKTAANEQIRVEESQPLSQTEAPTINASTSEISSVPTSQEEKV